MAIIQLKYTLTSFKILQDDFNRKCKMIDIISKIVFTLFYGYLIYSNIDNLFYLLMNIILFALYILLTVLDKTYKNNQNKHTYNRREKERYKESRIKTFRVIKSFKYIINATTCIIAIYQIIKSNYMTISMLFSIISICILIVKLFLELISHYLNVYFDYFRLAFELDKDESLITSLSLEERERKLFKELAELKGESPYTEREAEIVKEIKQKSFNVSILRKQNKAMKKEKKYTYKGKIKNYKNEIKKLKEKQTFNVKEVDKQYNDKLIKAKELISNKVNLENILKEAEKILSKVNNDILNFILIFTSLIRSYSKGDYKNVAVNALEAILAVVLYFIDPDDVVKDDEDNFGYIDDAHLISKCYDGFQEEIDKFIEWKSKGKLTNR